MERDEAFIDEYGRLMNRKTYRVLRELKHYVKTHLWFRENFNCPLPRQQGSPVKDYLKDTVRDTAMEATEITVDRAADIFFMKCFRMYGMSISFRFTAAQKRLLHQKN